MGEEGEMTTQVLIRVTLGVTILTVIGPISFCPKQLSCQSLLCRPESTDLIIMLDKTP